MLPGRVATPSREFLVERGLPYVDTLAEAMAVLRGWKAWSTYQEPDAPARPADMAATPVHLVPSASRRSTCRSNSAEAGTLVL